MEVYANHTFQPDEPVRRADLAAVVQRALERAAAREPARAEAWRGAAATFSDVPAGHPTYAAASLAVGAGIMRVDPGQTFSPRRTVTGAEAADVVDRLTALVLRR
jgi:hypothetical protein